MIDTSAKIWGEKMPVEKLVQAVSFIMPRLLKYTFSPSPPLLHQLVGSVNTEHACHV